MVDLHSHILPGLDDGARTLDDSCALARRAAEDGVRAIAATPHVRGDYPTTAGQMEEQVDAVRRRLVAESIPVEILHGGEIALDRLPELSPDELERFTIAQTGRYLLVEFPYTGWPLGIDEQLFELRAAGLSPVLAHPERNREVQTDPGRLERLVETGALVQVTAASLDGRVGRSAKAAAERLLELGFVHLLASDAHTPEVREAGLSAAVKMLGDNGLARYLTEEAPAAVVAGEDVPPPPERRRRRFGFL